MSPFQVNNKNTRSFHTYDILNTGTPFPLHIISGLEFVNSPLIVAEASNFVVVTNATFSTTREVPTHLVDSVSHPSMAVLLFSFNTTVLLDSWSRLLPANAKATMGKKRDERQSCPRDLA